jgi:RNA polymerase sigma factor (sigma-70 family)
MLDDRIVEGLMKNDRQRPHFEKELYLQYEYFIKEGCRKYHLSYDDSFSAFSDAILATIHNIVNARFDNRFSLKTYLFQIFHNKCVDLVRKIANNKEKVNRSMAEPELLNHLPDRVRNVMDKLIEHENILVLKKYLDVIGEKCREILLMFEDGYTDKDIAEKMAFNNAAVAKTSRLRCREKMKNLFASHERE